jgi:hypothetical protein
MNDAKYIGLDVHQATISVAVRDAAGKLAMEAILETKADTILQFLRGLHGSLHVTFEEGTCAAWLHDLLKPRVTEVLVCDPRKNALLKAGNKNDRIDARKLADLLRTGLLSPVYHGEAGVRTLKELARSYLAITRDLTRVMTRLKALYRSWAIPCAGEQVYAPRHRAEWLAKITEPGVRRRAEFYYRQFDALAALRQQARRELLAESRKHSATKLLKQIPSNPSLLQVPIKPFCFSLAVVQLPLPILTSFFYEKCHLLKARVIIHAYNHHVRLLSPEPVVVQQPTVYSGRRSRHCYAITCEKCPVARLPGEPGYLRVVRVPNY